MDRENWWATVWCKSWSQNWSNLASMHRHPNLGLVILRKSLIFYSDYKYYLAGLNIYMMYILRGTFSCTFCFLWSYFFIKKKFKYLILLNMVLHLLEMIISFFNPSLFSVSLIYTQLVVVNILSWNHSLWSMCIPNLLCCWVPSILWDVCILLSVCGYLYNFSFMALLDLVSIFKVAVAY